MSLLTRPDQEVRVFLMGDAVGCAVRGQRTPDGYYRYVAYCSVPGHADAGMRAIVVVE